jgi:hypothetical protein
MIQLNTLESAYRTRSNVDWSVYLQEQIFECNITFLDEMSTESKECCQTEVHHRIGEREENAEDVGSFHR